MKNVRLWYASNRKSVCYKISITKSTTLEQQYQQKVKVTFTLEQATKAQKGKQRYSYTLSLTSGARWGGWSTPRPGRFTPVPII